VTIRHRDSALIETIWKLLHGRALCTAMSECVTPCPLEMVAAHGIRAAQLAVDQIVLAVRQGDDEAARAWDQALRAIDRELERLNNPRVSHAPYRVR
jgi:hypothetical protein